MGQEFGDGPLTHAVIYLSSLLHPVQFSEMKLLDHPVPTGIISRTHSLAWWSVPSATLPCPVCLLWSFIVQIGGDRSCLGDVPPVSFPCLP